MDAKVKTLTRALAWVAWGAALMLAPGAARTMGEGGSLPFGYYLWTSAIPLAFVAAALAWAMRARLSRWRRALALAALAALLVYLAVLFASCMGSMRLGFALRWPEWALRYVAWALWGIALAVWVLPSDAPEPVSPIGCHPGAETLTEREREVVEALVTGSTQAQVAEALAISPSSVATYRSRACEKLGVASLGELAAPVVGDIASSMEALLAGLTAYPMTQQNDWLEEIDRVKQVNAAKMEAKLNANPSPMDFFSALKAIRTVLEKHREVYLVNEGANTLDDTRNLPHYDWQDEHVRTAGQHRHNLRLAQQCG